MSDQEFCSFEEEPEMALVIGQEFCSFEELSESVKKWEKINFVTLYTRSSRSIEAARRARARARARLCLYGSSYKLVDVLTRQTSKIVRHEAAGDDNRKNSEASTRYGTVWRLY